MQNTAYTVLMAIIIMLIISGAMQKAYPSSVVAPPDLWKYVIAESSSEIMKHGEDAILPIVLVVRNRIEKNMWHGLCAAKRKNLDAFVNKEVNYLKHKKGVNYAMATKRIIIEVFSERVRDITDSAVFYENIEAFGFPSWAADSRGDLDAENFRITYQVGAHVFFKKV